MKKSKKKLALDKLTVSTLSSVKGGYDAGSGNISYCAGTCDSINTKFTEIAHCC